VSAAVEADHRTRQHRQGREAFREALIGDPQPPPSDQHGRAVGKVHDVRLEQDGPVLEGLGPSLRLEGLIVGRRALGARFGFGRGGVRRPWLLKLVFGSLGHDGRYVAWDRIQSIRAQQIRIIGTAGDLPRPGPSE
jgi:hypothetical protein